MTRVHTSTAPSIGLPCPDKLVTPGLQLDPGPLPGLAHELKRLARCVAHSGRLQGPTRPLQLLSGAPSSRRAAGCLAPCSADLAGPVALKPVRSSEGTMLGCGELALAGRAASRLGSFPEAAARKARVLGRRSASWPGEQSWGSPSAASNFWRAYLHGTPPLSRGVRWAACSGSRAWAPSAAWTSAGCNHVEGSPQAGPILHGVGQHGQARVGHVHAQVFGLGSQQGHSLDEACCQGRQVPGSLGGPQLSLQGLLGCLGGLGAGRCSGRLHSLGQQVQVLQHGCKVQAPSSLRGHKQVRNRMGDMMPAGLMHAGSDG